MLKWNTFIIIFNSSFSNFVFLFFSVNNKKNIFSFVLKNKSNFFFYKVNISQINIFNIEKYKKKKDRKLRFPFKYNEWNKQKHKFFILLNIFR